MPKPQGTDTCLKELKTKFPVSIHDFFKSLKKELQAVLLATICYDHLEDVRPTALADLRTVSVALARKGRMQRLKFKIALGDLGLPNNVQCVQLRTVGKSGNGGKNPMEFSKETYKCELCGYSRWKERPFFVKEPCNCCEEFIISEKNKAMLEFGLFKMTVS
jgi:hypothetical protein